MALPSLFEISLAVISFVFLYFLSNNNALPKNWPVVGMLPDLLLQLHRVHDWSVEVLELCHCTFQFKGPWFSQMNILITVEPANIHYIMSSNFYNFPKGSQFKEIFDILGDGIFNSDLDLWKKQRKIAQTFFKNCFFHQFLVKSSQEKVEKGLVPVLEHVSKQGIMVDLQDLFQRFTFDATCMIVTGYDPGCLSIKFPQVSFSKAMDDAEEVLFYRHIVPETVWKLQRRLQIGPEKKLSQAWQELDHIIAQIITRKKEELMISKAKNNTKEENEKGTDLLTSYMNEEYEDDKSLRDTIINLMLAGGDTTSSALSWFFCLVSKNPQVETKIREELKGVILPSAEAEKWRLFNVEEVKGLVYLHSALCESLRLYPPVPFQHKAPLKSDTLPTGHHVNPKMKILFSLYAMGRMTSIWGDDCMEFKPERWISDRGGIKHEPSYKFLSFNAGPRTCLGKEVAFTQMKLVAAAIIYNYHVEVVDEHCVIPSLSIILHMKDGMKVRIAKRWA